MSARNFYQQPQDVSELNVLLFVLRKLLSDISEELPKAESVLHSEGIHCPLSLCGGERDGIIAYHSINKWSRSVWWIHDTLMMIDFRSSGLYKVICRVTEMKQCSGTGYSYWLSLHIYIEKSAVSGCLSPPTPPASHFFSRLYHSKTTHSNPSKPYILSIAMMST